MNGEKLSKYINHPERLSVGDLKDIEKVISKYPYCQVAHVLMAMGSFKHNRPVASQRLTQAAIYTHDRILLKKLLEEVTEKPTGDHKNRCDKKRKAQMAIIDAFIESTPEFKYYEVPRGGKEVQQEDLSKPSTELKEEFVSETLAIIFSKQGKKARAIHIYKKLILKFPEKKAYFASRIEALKKN